LTACAESLAQFLMDAGKFTDAEDVYKELAANKALGRAARDGFDLLAARVSMRAEKYGDALKKLQALADRLPADSPHKNKARVLQAECLAGLKKYAAARDKLNALLKEAKDDKDVRAQAYNALGRCHLLQQQHKEALWDFLRVDVVYNQNKEEHARALYNLSKLFHLLKDKDRGDECAARLRNKKFAGTEYQRRLAQEGTAKGKEK